MPKPIDEQKPKPLRFVGSSRKDLQKFPKEVRITFGQALFDAQTGKTHPDAKPLKGYGGAGVLEVVENHDGDTYRAVYTVKFADIVYALHAFKKKSKAGRKTPLHILNIIDSRLQAAEQDYAEFAKQKKASERPSRSAHRD
ncbi:MAG TPA: type II toxin-antitoxin system RelE/ParE family toxin [Urbifossiella sp.]|nr:type II toxin-antitoxin system RelE/ParE family toxin [Urbifossiella sp.]